MTPTITKSSSRQYVHLLADVASSTKELVAAHADQLGDEVKSEADRATTILGLFSAAGTLMSLGFVCVIVAFTQLLQERYSYSGTASWSIAGVITFATGILAYLIARMKLADIQWIPRKSLISMQESFQWATRK